MNTYANTNTHTSIHIHTYMHGTYSSKKNDLLPCEAQGILVNPTCLRPIVTCEKYDCVFDDIQRL